MVITWYGQACFRIQSGDKTLVIDPFSKSIGLTPPNVQADVVFVTHEHSDHNNIKALRGDPFIINGPGEYDIKGIKARGIESFHDNEEGAKRGHNTLYFIELEDVRILHMGDIGQHSLREEQVQAMGRVDVLMIPVGGNFTIAAREAVNIANSLEPGIVIPMHYKIPKLAIKELEDVKGFLKEFGEEGAKAQEKLALKAKDFDAETEKSKVVVLKI